MRHWLIPLVLLLVSCGGPSSTPTPAVNAPATQTRVAELAERATLTAPTATAEPSPTPTPQRRRFRLRRPPQRAQPIRGLRRQRRARHVLPARRLQRHHACKRQSRM